MIQRGKWPDVGYALIAQHIAAVGDTTNTTPGLPLRYLPLHISHQQQRQPHASATGNLVNDHLCLLLSHVNMLITAGNPLNDIPACIRMSAGLSCRSAVTSRSDCGPFFKHPSSDQQALQLRSLNACGVALWLFGCEAACLDGTSAMMAVSPWLTVKQSHHQHQQTGRRCA